MQSLEVSGAVRQLCGSLGVKGLKIHHMVGHPRCVFINYIWLKLIVEHN